MIGTGKRMMAAGVLAGLMLGTAQQASAVIMLNGGVYVEDFDSMGVGGTTPPTGWVVQPSAGTNPANALGLPSAPDVTAGGIGNNGYNAGVNTGSDRALGVFGGAVGDVKQVRATFTNNTGAAVSSFDLSYDLETWYWRFDSATPRGAGFNLQYIGADGTEDMGASFDGAVTNAAVTVSGGVWLSTPTSLSNLGGTFSPLTPIAAGASFTLVWNARDGEPEPVSGNSRHGVVSVNNFSIDFGQGSSNQPTIPEPATAGLALLGLGALGARRRRNA